MIAGMPWEGIVGLACGPIFLVLFGLGLCAAAKHGDEQADQARAMAEERRALARATGYDPRRRR